MYLTYLFIFVYVRFWKISGLEFVNIQMIKLELAGIFNLISGLSKDEIVLVGRGQRHPHF